MRPLLIALTLCLVLGGCGTTTASDPDGPTAETAVASPRRVPSAAAPLRVLVVGDSVAAEVRLPVEEALEAGGEATVTYTSQPSLPREPAYLEVWKESLTTTRPEVVVVLIGLWEQRLLSPAPGGLPAEADYREEQLQPFVRSVTETGAELLWVAAPALADPEASSVVAELNDRFERFAATTAQVEFLDGNALVAGPDGAFAEVIDTQSGPVRVRAPDGIHLCPDGSVLVATEVVRWITDRWDVEVGSDWQGGVWRAHPFSASSVCPPL